MQRRAFLAGTGALLARPADPAVTLRPRALREGDLVGLITPSAYVSDPDRLALAAATIKYFGLRARLGKSVGKRTGYLAGSIEERLDDLHEMFRDPEVKAVFAVRGGYGSAQLLDRIDYDLIRNHPKIFLGFSDITALHLAIGKRTGLVTSTALSSCPDFRATPRHGLKKAMFSAEPLGTVTNPPEPNACVPSTHCAPCVPAAAVDG